ncbi:transglutaminase domain-containing protein [Aquisalimonas asiatica]|uniref:Transglutaminase-like enzyme, putative cysteine protease n=1 Tax=Aquisalimonas asiatica TaxID=406100 RepID=A0A1H8UKS1_9GAMM|nr:transglutaminase family protein [Aquisalimonas asiatica]SEP03830.1 Transglutaminase-like enzyme, putative cysteine protease [Aquisalimonas asiatica]
MRLEVGCVIRMECPQPTPLILLLRPRSGRYQWIISERYALTPHVPATEYVDGFGNLCQRLVAPPGLFTVETSAEVDVAAEEAIASGAPYVPVETLPDEVLVYLMPSRFCESDRLGAVASEAAGSAAMGYDQVAAISQWVYQHLTYLPESDPSPVSALEVYARGEGVCRDFAHLAVALCRSLNIPARMVAGYLQDLEPMDLHAWFEAYVGGRWYTFDPTRPGNNKARVTLAQGRDAADIPVFNQFGPPVTPSRMDVFVRPLSR